MSSRVRRLFAACVAAAAVLLCAACTTELRLVPTSVEAVGEPSVTEYFVGDKPDLSDVKLRITYDNGTHAVKKILPDMVTPSAFGQAGEQTVTVVYAEGETRFTLSFPVRVSAVTLRSISAVCLRNSFPARSVIGTEDVVVTAAYNDPDAARPVTDCIFLYQNGDCLHYGDSLVTVRYTENGVTAETAFAVNVTKRSPVVNVECRTESLCAGDPLPEISLGAGSTDGEITWETGQTLAAGTHDYGWSFVPDSADYETTSGKVSLMVNPARLTEISVSGKTDFTALDTLSAGDITVTASYGDGARHTVAGFEILYQNGACLHYGDSLVTVRYTENGVTAETAFAVSVTKCAPVVNVECRTEDLFAGDSLPEISLGAGSTDGEITWETGQVLAAGTRDYAWSFVPDSADYETASGKVSLTVNPARLTEITASGKTDYIALDTLSAGDITVTASYGDGAAHTVAGFEILYQNGDCLHYGDSLVTVRYTENGVTAETKFAVNVTKRSPVVNVECRTENLCAGDPLPEISLGAGSTDGEVSWETGQMLAAGTHDYGWKFVPDSADYETASGNVSLTADSGTVDTEEKLRAALLAAKAGQEILLSGRILLTTSLTVDKALTLVGENAVLAASGALSEALVTVSAQGVTLKGIRFEGGTAALRVSGSAELDGVVLAGAETGLFVTGGAVTARGLFTEGNGCGVRLAKDGTAARFLLESGVIAEEKQIVASAVSDAEVALPAAFGLIETAGGCLWTDRGYVFSQVTELLSLAVPAGAAITLGGDCDLVGTAEISGTLVVAAGGTLVIRESALLSGTGTVENVGGVTNLGLSLVFSGIYFSLPYVDGVAADGRALILTVSGFDYDCLFELGDAVGSFADTAVTFDNVTEYGILRVTRFSDETYEVRFRLQ